ncbi:MAG: helix-turn-helix transcriptional regulator [Mycolicibacterium sp.]|uniref:helix-turn-helix transcriptional regulator n=1 Tax=Mycolicibacterium sp. TaxID=2320850 RepID=UPI003D09FEB3
MSHRVVRGFQLDHFRELRKAAGMTMTDLARLSQVSPSTISSWERKGKAPDITRLVQVARVLGVDFTELVHVDPSERMVSDWRVRKGYSQIDLAREAGLSTAVVAYFERAQVKWNPGHAEKIAAALDMSVTELEAAWQRARVRPAGSPA